MPNQSLFPSPEQIKEFISLAKLGRLGEMNVKDQEEIGIQVEEIYLEVMKIRREWARKS